MTLFPVGTVLIKHTHEIKSLRIKHKLFTKLKMWGFIYILYSHPIPEVRCILSPIPNVAPLMHNAICDLK